MAFAPVTAKLCVKDVADALEPHVPGHEYAALRPKMLAQENGLKSALGSESLVNAFKGFKRPETLNSCRGPRHRGLW